MASTVKVPLGGSTLNRKWYLDINSNTYASPTWVGVFGVTEFKPSKEPTKNDNSDFDGGGWHSQNVAALAWSVELKVERKVLASDATAYDPGQELLRAASDGMGTSNVVDIRYYEVTASGPAVEAYRGYACVTWSPDGGDMAADDTVSITLDGRGARSAITHPDAAAVVPVLYSVDPAVGVQAGGTLHYLTGAGFFADGVDDVQSIKLGVTNVPTFQTHSDHTLSFVAPAKAAGPFVVYVTNTVGESITATVTITVS